MFPRSLAPSSSPRPVLLAVLALLCGSLLIAGCGGSDNDSGAEETLDRALTGGGAEIDSGVLKLNLTAGNAEIGEFNLLVEGPFVLESDGSLPQADLALSIDSSVPGQSLDADAQLVISERNAFVTLQGETFEVGEQLFGQLAAASDAAAAQAEDESGADNLSQFGVDAREWFTNLTDEGTADVGGTETNHISGNLDVEKVFEDLQSIAEQTGQAGALNNADVQQFTDGIEDTRFDLYTATDDNSVRKIDAELTVPGDDASGDVTVTFGFELGDVNSKQTISEPGNAQPIQGLLEQLNGLGGLLGAGAAGGSAGGSGSGGAGSAQGSGLSEEYFDCVQKAGNDADKIAACVP